jgi:hypothetical protein
MNHKRAWARCRRRVVAPRALQAHLSAERATVIVRNALGTKRARVPTLSGASSTVDCAHHVTERVFAFEGRQSAADANTVSMSMREVVTLHGRRRDRSGHEPLRAQGCVSSRMEYCTTEPARIWQDHGSRTVNCLVTDDAAESVARGPRRVLSAESTCPSTQPTREERWTQRERDFRRREDELAARENEQRRVAAAADDAMRQHEAELATKAELLLRREADFARKAALQQIAFLQREGALVAKESWQRKEAQRLEALQSALWERMNQDARKREADIIANEQQRRRAMSLDEESTREGVLRSVAQSELAADEAASRRDIEGMRNRESRRTERCMATEGKLAAAVSHVVATEASSRVTVRAAWWSAM